MNKNQFIAGVASKAGCSNEVAASCYDAMVATILETVKNGDKVALPDFGNFELKTRPARVGVNPSTGEKINIAESRVLNFKPAKKIKDEL